MLPGSEGQRESWLPGQLPAVAVAQEPVVVAQEPVVVAQEPVVVAQEPVVVLGGPQPAALCSWCGIHFGTIQPWASHVV